MSEQGRSQSAWTQGSLGAGIMLYLSLIEPVGTPRTLNRAQASGDVLMSLTMGQRERNWKTKRPWILMYHSGESLLFSHEDAESLEVAVFPLLHAWSPAPRTGLGGTSGNICLGIYWTIFLSRWGVLFQACRAGMSLRSVPGTKGRLMASSAREFLNSLWPNNTGKPSKYAYITSVNTIQP